MSSEMAGGHSMSGMMGDDDMTKLGAAQGAEAARLFLTQMIAHHEGAVVMAKTESSDGTEPRRRQAGQGHRDRAGSRNSGNEGPAGPPSSSRRGVGTFSHILRV